jgi:hypothetical protein
MDQIADVVECGQISLHSRRSRELDGWIGMDLARASSVVDARLDPTLDLGQGTDQRDDAPLED